MFLRIDFDGSTNTVALKSTAMKVQLETPGGYYQRNLVQKVNHYSMPGIWVSKAQSTRGALVLGEVEFYFRDIPNDQILSYEDVLYEAGDVKADRKSVV